MGQCYSVRLKIQVKDAEGARKALTDKIARAEQEHVDYSLDHYRSIGVDTDSLEGLLKVFYGGWNANLQLNGKGLHEADFECCYGWEGVMMDAFDELAPFLEEGSELKIYPDSGCDHAVIRNGKARWLS